MRSLVAVATVLAYLALAAAAGATTVTLGTPTITDTVGVRSCSAECTAPDGAATYAQTEVPGGQTVAPAPGRVKSWRVFGTVGNQGTLKLVVIDLAGVSGTARALSAAATNLAGGANAVDLPIETGDVIGASMCRCLSGSTTVDYASVPGASYVSWGSTGFKAAGETSTGLTGSDQAFQFNADVVLSPAVTSVSPRIGSSVGGTEVVIDGQYLDGATAVRFGDVAATSFTVESPTRIRATAPAGASRSTVPVTVSGPGGTSGPGADLTYTYRQAPSISAISPASGPASGGTEVTITGADLDGATAVDFGATRASLFVVDSATQMRVASPAGVAGSTVDVRVTGPGGTSGTGPGTTFAFAAPAATPTPTPTDTVAPRLGGLSVVPRSFVAANIGPSVIAAKVTTTVRYTLDEAATSTFRVRRRTRGFRVGRRCAAKPARRASRKRCTRLVDVKGSFTHAGVAGSNRLTFTGRLGGKALGAGTYVLGARPRDAAGNIGTERTARFTIRRR